METKTDSQATDVERRDAGIAHRVARTRATLYLDQRATLWAGNLGLQLICVVVLYPYHPPGHLALWMVANGSLLALRARATARLRRGEIERAADIDGWFRMLAAYLFIAGVIWGAGAFVLMPPLHEPRTMVFLLTLMGVCWGAAVSLSMTFRAVVAFVMPVTLLTAGRLAWWGSDEALLLIVLTIAFAGFVLATARNYAKTIDTALKLDSENLILLAEVSAARDAAEQINAEKSRFLAAVSHDLRQPLHAARLAMETLKSQVQGDAQQLVVAGSVRALRNLESQFDALLELSELDAGALHVHSIDFALRPLCEEVVQEFLTSARRRGITLAPAMTSAWVHADPQLFRRILRNLLDNAIKYTDEGSVSLAVEDRVHEVVVSVSDSGPGIEPGLLDRVFEPYVRLHESQQTPGHGLGLAIVAQLCQRMGIPIEVHSVPQTGTRFSCTLPRAASPAAPATRGETDHVLAGCHILLVDDDLAARNALGVLLDAWGCRVSMGESLDGALVAAAAVSRPPDAIISDYALGAGTDGIEVIARVRTLHDPELPGLIVSGVTGATLQQRADELGVPVLRKPLEPSALQAALTTAILG